MRRMTLPEALELADCVSPAPAAAHQALIALRAEVERLQADIDSICITRPISLCDPTLSSEDR
jgi:hypothetical protein